MNRPCDASFVNGEEIDVTCCYAISGREFCTIRVEHSQVLRVIALQAWQWMYQDCDDADDDGTVILFVDDARVLDDRLRLDQVVLSAGPTCRLAAASFRPEDAATTLCAARRQRILDSLDDILIAVPLNLSRQCFGEDLAARAYDGMVAGLGLNERIRLATRNGMNWSSVEFNWSLGRDKVRYHKPCESARSLRERVAEFGGIVLLEESSSACGDVTLRVGDAMDVWRDREVFVEFWKSMSERSIAAYCAGLHYDSKQKNWKDVMRSHAELSIGKTVLRSDFFKLGAQHVGA